MSENDLEQRKQSSEFPYSEVFEKCFPYYLSLGMSVTEYWDGDNTYPKAFREAEKLRMKRSNYEAWLHGRYIYDALCEVQPIFQAFAKRGTKPYPYADKPYALGEEEVAKAKEDRKKKELEKGRIYMETMMSKWNKSFEDKEVKGDVDNSRSVGSTDKI